MTRNRIFAFLFCLLIGFTMISIGRMTNGQHLFIPASALEDYRISIAGEQQEIEKMQKQINEAREKLGEYIRLQEDHQKLSGQLTATLREEQIRYRMMSGEAALTGPGVQIVVDDGTRELAVGENPNDILVHDLDILLILNDLKVAGAEAIAINGQRLVDLSSVNCSGYTVRINGQFFARPFVIEAIGDASRMSAQLVGPAGFGTVLKQWGLQFKVNMKDEIQIPAYSESRRGNYAQPATKDTEKGGNAN